MIKSDDELMPQGPRCHRGNGCKMVWTAPVYWSYGCNGPDAGLGGEAHDACKMRGLRWYCHEHGTDICPGCHPGPKQESTFQGAWQVEWMSGETKAITVVDSTFLCFGERYRLDVVSEPVSCTWSDGTVQYVENVDWELGVVKWTTSSKDDGFKSITWQRIDASQGEDVELILSHTEQYIEKHGAVDSLVCNLDDLFDREETGEEDFAVIPNLLERYLKIVDVLCDRVVEEMSQSDDVKFSLIKLASTLEMILFRCVADQYKKDAVNLMLAPKDLAKAYSEKILDALFVSAEELLQRHVPFEEVTGLASDHPGPLSPIKTLISLFVQLGYDIPVDRLQRILKALAEKVSEREVLEGDAVGRSLKCLDDLLDHAGGVLMQTYYLPKKDQKYYGFSCDGCGQFPIIGPRFKCALCTESYDLCEYCHERRHEVHAEHDSWEKLCPEGKVVLVETEGLFEDESGANCTYRVVQDGLFELNFCSSKNVNDIASYHVSHEFEKGDKIEVNYKRSGQFLDGKIDKVRADGKYDIFDGRDMLEAVDPIYVRAAGVKLGFRNDAEFRASDEGDGWVKYTRSEKQEINGDMLDAGTKIFSAMVEFSMSESDFATRKELARALTNRSRYSGFERDGLNAECIKHLKKKLFDNMRAEGFVFPSWWDLNALSVQPVKRSAGLEFDEDAYLYRNVQYIPMNMRCNITLTKEELGTMQELFDASISDRFTRDRKDGSLPGRLRLMVGKRLQSEMNWKGFKAKQEEIAKDLEDRKKKGEEIMASVSNLKTAGTFPNEERFHVNTDANEGWFFHGTTMAAANGIMSGDFLLNLAGSHAGTMYGKGIYLAESCSKSDEYTELDVEYGIRTMLVCRGTLGSVNYCDDGHPNGLELVKSCVEGPFHSVLGDREKVSGTFREFIVYHHDQVYPEYVFFYLREDEKHPNLDN